MKRKKGKKASKRTVRCTLCTTYRWLGNSTGRWNANTERKKEAAKYNLKSQGL